MARAWGPRTALDRPLPSRWCFRAPLRSPFDRRMRSGPSTAPARRSTARRTCTSDTASRSRAWRKMCNARAAAWTSCSRRGCRSTQMSACRPLGRRSGPTARRCRSAWRSTTCLRRHTRSPACTATSTCCSSGTTSPAPTWRSSPSSSAPPSVRPAPRSGWIGTAPASRRVSTTSFGSSLHSAYYLLRPRRRHRCHRCHHRHQQALRQRPQTFQRPAPTPTPRLLRPASGCTPRFRSRTSGRRSVRRISPPDPSARTRCSRKVRHSSCAPVRGAQVRVPRGSLLPHPATQDSGLLYLSLGCGTKQRCARGRSVPLPLRTVSARSPSRGRRGGHSLAIGRRRTCVPRRCSRIADSRRYRHAHRRRCGAPRCAALAGAARAARGLESPRRGLPRPAARTSILTAAFTERYYIRATAKKGDRGPASAVALSGPFWVSRAYPRRGLRAPMYPAQVCPPPAEEAQVLASSSDAGAERVAPQPPAAAEPAEESENVCSVCLDRPIDSVIVHGGTCHRICCHGAHFAGAICADMLVECAEHVRETQGTCPKCRQHIDQILRAFD